MQESNETRHVFSVYTSIILLACSVAIAQNPPPAALGGRDAQGNAYFTANVISGQAQAILNADQCVSASNSGTAYTCSTIPTFTPSAGSHVRLNVDVTNTGSATLAVNGSPAAVIKKLGNSANLVSDDFDGGQREAADLRRAVNAGLERRDNHLPEYVHLYYLIFLCGQRCDNEGQSCADGSCIGHDGNDHQHNRRIRRDSMGVRGELGSSIIEGTERRGSETGLADSFCTFGRIRFMPNHNELDSYSGPENIETNEYLRQRHGECFMGFPLYRLVHTAFLWQFSAGEWCDWDVNLPVESRGTLVTDETGNGLTPATVAERQITEMRRRLKYAQFAEFPGWVLERWMPPTYFGTPQWWNSQLVPGTTLPKLGPYPYRGGYISVMGEGFRPYLEAPTGPFLDRLIEMWDMMQAEVLSMTPETYVAKREAEMRAEQDETDAEWRRNSSSANMTAMQPFFSTYLEAGRARALAAEHSGLTSHYGN